MKVKTFTGNDAEKVDTAVNEWLGTSRAKVRFTNTAIGGTTIHGTSQGMSGAVPIKRNVTLIAISVWYE
jgi:hypothetical protein